MNPTPIRLVLAGLILVLVSLLPASAQDAPCQIPLEFSSATYGQDVGATTGYEIWRLGTKGYAIDSFKISSDKTNVTLVIKTASEQGGTCTLTMSANLPEGWTIQSVNQMGSTEMRVNSGGPAIKPGPLLPQHTDD